MLRDISQLTLKTEEGEKNFDVLFNFYSEEFNKKYMVICASDADSVNGQIQVTPIAYESDEEGYVKHVQEIETQEEFEHVKLKFEEELARYNEHHHHDHDHDCACGGHCGCHHDHE